MKKLIAILMATALAFFGATPAKADEFVIKSTTPYTASILGTPLWTANIPTSILLTDSYAKVEFPITALAPYDLLAEGAFGVDVNFELWSLQGTKIAYDTLYSSNWNPVSNQNMISFYVDDDDIVPNAVMRITTEQTFRTNGFISRYIEDVTQINVALSYGTPPAEPKLTSSSETEFKIVSQANSGILHHEIHLSYILGNSLSPTSRRNFSAPFRIKTVQGSTFSLTEPEIGSYLIAQGVPNANYVLLTVASVSEAGPSSQSNGIYIDSTSASKSLLTSKVSISGPKSLAPESKGVYRISVLNSKNKGLPGKTPTVSHFGLGKVSQLGTSTDSTGALTVEVSTVGFGEGTFSLNVSLDGKSSVLEVKVTTAPSFQVAQRTLATFSSTATGLTSQQKAQVKAAVEANPSAEKFICTGIRYVSQPLSENIKVRKRAKAACDYAKTLNPELSTWYQNKPTEARSYAGKVLLTIKSPAN
jgi:hypothetical protein